MKFTTLFDSAYLPKGLAMYQSLAKNSSEPFELYILPMDEECRWTLTALELPNVHLVDLMAVERALYLVKERALRTRTEYCWMMASVLTDYLLSDQQLGLDALTYLDADLFFFSDPAPVFDEIGERSIAITPHRLIPSKKYLEVNGLFNVGWVTFRNTEIGRRCLREWASDCRNWCFNRNEPGRFGDQKYLDSWPVKYGDAVCVLGIGVNVAPWNLANWEVTEGPRVDGVPIVCYHLHEFSDLGDERYRLTYYDLRDEDRLLIYGHYIRAYQEAKELRYQAVMKMAAERA